MRAQLVEAERALADDPALPAAEPSLGPARPAARLRRRRAPAAAPPGDRGAGRLRRARRSRPPTSSAHGARLARRRRRHRRPRPPGRGPRRPARRGGRRPLPARLRLGRGRPGRSRTPRRWRSRARRRRPAGPPRARRREDPRRPAGRRVAFARAVREEMERRKRRLGILSYDDLLSQLADALERRRRARPRADAPALADRARRRVPGHRPGAVAGARPGLLRPRHDGADRRPQAGHLRLPRRRRHDLPRGGGDRHHPADARASTGAATPPCSPRSRPCCAGAELGDPRIVVHDVERPPRRESRLSGAPHGGAVPAARRTPRAPRRAAAPSRSLVGQVRPHVARDLALDVRALLASGAQFEGRAARAARRRGDRLPARRPRRRPGRAARGRACRR